MTGVIRTITGDLSAAEAGPTFAHEHLIIDTPLVEERWPHIHLPSIEEAVAEIQTCVAAGVRTVVDAMPAASGRHPERLARVSIRTGMRIVAVTGLHTARYYEDVPWTREESPEQLAQRFVDDIEEGIDRHDYLGDVVDRSDFRAGVIKVATLAPELSDRDRRVFEAAAMAHARTGAPIITHTEGGLGGLLQIEALTGLGVLPERITLSHTDKVVDPGYHRAMLSTGVFLCYDQTLRWEHENLSARLVSECLAAGHRDQILLGTDGARRSLWATLGGSPGLAYLHQGFIIELEDVGLSPSDISALFVDNPARYLALGGP